MSKRIALVSEGKFAFTNGIFFAEASDRSQHRRATQEELRNHFASGSDKNYAADWFEAQLIHYGLQPSKVKSVARMRLFDAVREGALPVPLYITEVENKLKKEWTKQNKADKIAENGARSAALPKIEASKKSPSTKRKADVTLDININANGPESATSSVPPRSCHKRAKASADNCLPQWAIGRAARRGGSSQISSRPGPVTRTSPALVAAPAPRVSNMARRGARFFQQGRSQSLQIRSDTYSNSMNEHSFDEPPPPYEDYTKESSRDHGTAALLPLGLLNGRYDVSCPFVESQWPQYASELSLVLTISGSSLWGRFDLGIIEGIIYFEGRPWSSSVDSISFHWRGREAEGPILYDDEKNTGRMKFLGDGRIEAWIDYQGIQFKGQRLPGQGTRSEVDARTMRDKWDRYSEEEYDRLNEARWR